MVDLHSPSTPLTVLLPADLVKELQLLAQEMHLSLDQVVREACLAYTEPHGWQRCYEEWVRTHPDQPAAESAGNGTGLRAPIRSEEHTSELQSPCNLVCR